MHHARILQISSDGGERWLPASGGISGSLSFELLAVQFSDASRGWAVGEGGGLMTTDGGASWAAMSLSVCESNTDTWTSLVFSGARSPGELWAASSDGVICVSADYGVSWEPQTGTSQVRKKNATATQINLSPIRAPRP